MSELSEGQVISQRYRLDRLVGAGGMGAVWAATDASSGATVALKFMTGAALTNPEMHKRFIREARAATAVKHPCVVKIHEVVHDDLGAPVMVMDLLHGESLGALLERARPLSLRDFARIYLQVVSAVGTAHAAGIVHRDLKPDNIFLLAGASDGPEVRILDFGIAKLTALEGDAAQTAGLTDTGAMLGTPYYMSPEQVFGDKTIDHRADIWSLGVIMFEALSGVKPVSGESLGQLLRVITTGSIPALEAMASQLPRDVLDLSRQMLSLDRSQRPADLRGVYETFRKYTNVEAQNFAGATVQMSQADLGTARLSGSSLSATAARSPSSRVPLVAVIALLVGAIGGGALYFMRRAHHEPAAAAASGEPAAQPEAKPSASTAVAETKPSVSVATSAAPPQAPSVTAKPAKSIPHKGAPPPVVTSAAAAPVETAKKSTGGVASELPF